MYEATKLEREALIRDYKYNTKLIDLLDSESDKVRWGIPVGLQIAMAITDYQPAL